MGTRSPNKLIPADFTPTPSVAWLDRLDLVAVAEPSDRPGAIGIALGPDGAVPSALGFDRDALVAAGFLSKCGDTLLLPQPSGPALVAVGTGDAAELTIDKLRDLAASFARATSRIPNVALRLEELGDVEPQAAAQCLAEGVVLGRYRYSPLQSKPKDPPLESLELSLGAADLDDVTAGIRAAAATVRAASVARDLANTPAGHLTATDLGDAALGLGSAFGFAVEIFDKQALIDLGCGGLLGVNSGSAEEPRMVKLSYTGSDDGPRLAMVGKGITYDSGGISLKPSDPMHLLMKMDMGGAAAILGAFTAFGELGVSATVTAWLMCTDNMPSGTAYKLGDVLVARGGKTVEVKNTDAEGRLAMMDGLVLATETSPDAIVDIATLTGASLMALGQLTAALFGNDQALVDQVRAASTVTGEQVWQLPLQRAYRKQLDSTVADIANLGGPYSGATTAALFLDEFVAGFPWAHVDIAGTMQSDADDSWRSAGATGFGARLLLEFARRFSTVR